MSLPPWPDWTAEQWRAVVQPIAREGVGGLTRKFDATQHPRGEDGRFIEATQPRIFSRMTDVGSYMSWGEKKWGWRATAEDIRFGAKLGEVTGRLLTGEPIPRDQIPAKLYHVTTNAPAVESSGVLLGLLEDGGMGGGQAQGVSFTSSPEDAEVIQRELKRAVHIARGDVQGIEDFERYAREDEQRAGLPKGSLDAALTEVRRTWDVQKDRHKQYEAPDEQERVRRSNLGDLLNLYLYGRETASERVTGSRVEILKNPILFGQQKHLAKINPDHIQILEADAEDIPADALVTTGSDKFLHEVRVYADVPRRRKKAASETAHPTQPLPKVAKDANAFDETKHPRAPGGTEEGGQFTETGRSGVPTSDPTLAKQAKDGIVYVERLLPEAVKTARYENVSGTWGYLTKETQEAVELAYKEKIYESTSQHLFTADFDNDLKIALARKERDAIRQEGLKRVRALYPDVDPTTVMLSPDAPKEASGYVPLGQSELRHTDGSPLSAKEYRTLDQAWFQSFKDARDDVFSQFMASEEYAALREQQVRKTVHQQWQNLPPETKYQKAIEMRQRGELSGEGLEILAKEPEHWTTGVEQGDHTDEDYARTHAIALKLTELRMDEIRKERDIGEPKSVYSIRPAADPDDGFIITDSSDGTTVATALTQEEAFQQMTEWQEQENTLLSSKAVIESVWESWKRKSSEGLGLSLQLAAARELGGHHRMSPEEVQEAEKQAREHFGQYGMATLQAYVRAQWEVTQMVMQKAGEKEVSVYRGLMLSGDQVKTTTHEVVDESGASLRPTNVRTITKTPADADYVAGEYVSFEYRGHELTEPKVRTTPFTWEEVDAATREKVAEGWATMIGTKETTPDQIKAAYAVLNDWSKLQLLQTLITRGIIPLYPYESEEATVQRGVKRYLEEIEYQSTFTKLPNLSLKRAGAQSTTGTPAIANDWGGVGDLPPNPVRVVIRVQAPPTSVLSLPVYGQNAQSEHETVLLGTPDKWLWDAWEKTAPEFSNVTITTHKETATKAETLPLLIDLQAEDRGKPHWMTGVNWATVTKFDEAKHPRESAGSAEGGQFTETGHVGEATPDPVLAKQAEAGIAAVEKLLPTAISTADYETTAPVSTWNDVQDDLQDKVRQKWVENAYDDVDVDTSEVDQEVTRELEKDNQEVLDDAMTALEEGLEEKFPDTASQLPLETPLELFRRVDMDTVDYGEGEHEDDKTVKLDLDALRFTSGEELTDDEKRIVQTQWDSAYGKAFDNHLSKVFESDSYYERIDKVRDDEILQQWDDLSDQDKFQFLATHYPDDMADFTSSVEGGEPTTWTTGVESGDHTDEDYARTHAIALRLTEMRTDEIRKERGLLESKDRPKFTIRPTAADDPPGGFTIVGEDGTIVAHTNTEEEAKSVGFQWATNMSKRPPLATSTLIIEVWDQWKTSSSRGLSLSMQLAAAKELGGHHRLSPEEVQEAEKIARPYGGIETLQAYVRAQWEVTQTIMKKAGESKIKVYRGLMLPGDDIEMTKHEEVEVPSPYQGAQARSYSKLPELSLKRAGAQSTTGTPSVANDWNGVGNLPPKPVRVVIRIEAPSTSVLSLPVYGQNEQAEHETVLLGTNDKWLWDVWLRKAPEFSSEPIATSAKKAEPPPKKTPLVIDLQEADRDKPHWMSQVEWEKQKAQDKDTKK